MLHMGTTVCRGLLDAGLAHKVGNAACVDGFRALHDKCTTVCYLPM